jgi:RNA polymerase sigma-70 factor (ECF subfamily)
MTAYTLVARIANVDQQIRGWSVILPLPATMADGDADTIRAVLAGDVDRYAELVTKYQAQAIRLAFSFLGNYEDARDVSQDAFVSAYRSLGRFQSRAKFSTWFYRIVVNAATDAARRRSRQPRVVAGVGAQDPDDAENLFVDAPDPGAGPGEQLANRELGKRLTRAIGALPAQQRSAFLLHHVHGLALDEAAEIMGCRPGTVKAHVFRATEALREQLGPWQAEERRA